MKQKLLTFLFTMLFITTQSWAEIVSIDGLYYNLNEGNKTASVNNHRGEYPQGNIIIPSSVTYRDVEYQVVAISEYAFDNCSKLTSVTIPNSVTSIGNQAFRRCRLLTSVTMPNSIKSIGEYAFGDCRRLASITIPNSVTSIGQHAFEGCYGLTSVNIPNSVTSIGQYAFEGCYGLTSVNIPNSVTSIGQYAFKGCYGLTSVNIPNSVTSIGQYAFSGCSGLTSVNIPNSVTSIGQCAFCGCNSLTSVTIPNSVTSIEHSAFSGCKNLASINVEEQNTHYKSIDGVLYCSDDGTALICYPEGKNASNFTIPNSVTVIGEYAFSGCSRLTSVNIPSSVTSIGRSAFDGCSGLTSVNIPSSVTSIGWSAFDGCSGLTSVNIPSSVTSIEQSAFYGCSGLTSVNIPSSVTSIEWSAFDGCSGLTSVNIPASVSYIANNAFSGCKKLTAIDVSPDNMDYCSIDGILYNKEKNTLLMCPDGKTGSVNIPPSTTEIKSDAFGYCSKLTAIDVSPDNTVYSSVDGILYNKEKNTLLMCPDGKTGSVSIPSSATSISRRAFSGCSGLTSVTIPYSVTSIGDYAFNNCNLTIFLFSTNLKSYYDCFEGLSGSSVIFAFNSEFERLKNYWNGTIADIELPYYSGNIQSYLRGVSFKVLSNNYVSGVLQSVKLDNRTISPNEDGMYYVTGLDFDTSYDVTISYKTNEGKTVDIEETIKTRKPSVSLYTDSITQTSIRIGVSASNDTTCSPNKIGFIYDGKEYEYTKNKFVLHDLVPNSDYRFTPFADYGEQRITNKSRTYTTASLKPTLTAQYIGPTSISVQGSYTVKDAHVSETGFADQETTGNSILLTGLQPNSNYTVNYYVKTEEGSDETVSTTFATTDLILTTLQPKCVSNTRAVVAAETNISEDEPSVGFQWKKYDAPETLKPNEGYAAIYDGQLEGYLQNLQSTSYYNVRAFYKSADGTYYYGDWVTFDPSDFSFFEPTTHTYGATEVSSSSAKVKGYVMAGTDDIIEQGFEYWSVAAAEKRNIIHANVTTDNNVSVITCTGQVMTATLTGLLPNQTYAVRSFVKTTSGTTYGEQQTFTTMPDPTGIDNIEAEDIENDTTKRTVRGYYDLNGRKFSTLQKGLNIIRYSDGSAQKVFVK